MLMKTTKKVSSSYAGSDQLVDQVIGPDGKQFLGYRYDAEGDFYYTDDKDCWQANAGYNEIYDNMAAFVMMNIDQVRIRFTYENKDWMIQLWKGQYGNLLIGAEIGVYTAPSGSYTGQVGAVNHYDCADKEDWLKMDMTCYWRENNQGSFKKAFEREYDYYWWATGFVKGALTKYSWPRTELKALNRITFKNEVMANLFVTELRRIGFIRAVAANKLVDDSYFQNGKDVYLLWTSIYHDAFAEYQSENRTTTKKPTTTKAPTTATTRKPTTTAEPDPNAPPTTTKPTTTAAPTTATTKAPTTTQAPATTQAPTTY